MADKLVTVACCLMAWLSLPVPVWAGSTDTSDSPGIAVLTGEVLRERLTRRQDQWRKDTPWRTELAGRPLTVSGELGADVEQLMQPLEGSRSSQRNSLRALAVEAEVFYSLSDSVSLFAQWRLVRESRSQRPGARGRWQQHAERGEMWLHGQDVADSGLDVQWGRIRFEEERRWWWDQELDALRLYHDGDELKFSIAAARERGRVRSDQRGIDASQQGVRRWLANASWNWQPEQTIGLFVLRHDDRSATEVLGQSVAVATQDDSDARLTWIGASLRGEVALSPAGSIGYWFDLARMSGREHTVQYAALAAPATPPQSVVTGVATTRLRGGAVDVGLRWIAPLPAKPRLTLAQAATFGGARAGAGGGYRQTGLHSNQDDFGAEKEFARYGAALAPELSNLRITTIGVGLSLPAAGSLDLVYHRYRQVRAATELRGARIDASPTGLHTSVGSGIDLVATLHPAPRVELSAGLSTFRAGSAFGAMSGRRYHYRTLAMRVAF